MTPPEPDPERAVDLAGYIEQLRALKVWSGDPSVRELARRITTVRRGRAVAAGLSPESVAPVTSSTVGYCFQVRRVRLDLSLVVDLLQCLGLSDEQRAHWVVRLKELLAAPEGQVGAPVILVGGLPPDPSPLVGRDQVLTALEETPRVLLHGLPGVGKTSLAVASGHAWAEAAGAGHTVFVRLPNAPNQSVLRGADVVFEILRYMGFDETRIPFSLSARVQAVAGHLGAAATLLVVDGATSGQQVSWTQQLPPTCRVVITSRRPLRLPGLTRVRLPPLTSAAALHLLRRLTPEVGGGSDADWRELADRTSGIPLVVESVASAVRDKAGWSLPDHLSRLDERPSALGADPVLDESYERWPESTRTAFNLLCDWPGDSFTQDVAEAVVGDGARATEVVRTLHGEGVISDVGGSRYVLHDLFASFGRDRVVEDVPQGRRLDALRAAASLYAARCQESLVHPADETFHGYLDITGWWSTVRGNAVVLGETLLHRGLDEELISLAEASWRAYDRAGDYRTGIRLQVAAQQAAATRDAPTRVRAGYRRAMLEWRSGQPAAALTLLAEIAQREGGDLPDSARAELLNGMSVIELRQLDYLAARAHLNEALDIYQRNGDQPGQLNAHGNLGIVEKELGDLSTATAHFESAVALSDPSLNPTGHARIQGNLGDLLVEQGRHDQAVQCLEESARLHRAHGARVDEAVALASLGWAYALSSSFDHALAAIRRAQELAAVTGAEDVSAHVECRHGDVLRTMGDLDAAGLAYARARALANTVGAAYTRTRAEEGAALLLLAQGRTEEARRGLDDVLTTYRALDLADSRRVEAQLTGLSAAG